MTILQVRICSLLFKLIVIQKYKKLLNNLSFAKNNRSFQFFSVILHS
ncbi:hypothetical protein HMPREF0673_02817 [Leyella stercorea DSM 18206]|uniref:Uncharacterized protein n=1 Tax=Leyella stercorea DSM 18206 TaxID=1002367 RepID=G6B1P1_9BACT|nr:hypothetical protein HMPREF0673_02817 [Leyella stercorea DSM 18206]